MATNAGKRAADILGPFGRIANSFRDYERERRARVRDTLRRVLVDLEFQERLCGELRARRDGYPIRPEYPDWALGLADLLRNPAPKYSPGECEVVFTYAKQLHEESGDPDGDSSLATYLATEDDVPVELPGREVLSALARDLLPLRRP